MEQKSKIIIGDTMSKEKPRVEGEKREVYYEAIGVLVVSLTLVVLTKLGSFGLGISIALKIVFGDWSWLLVLMAFILGVRFIITRKGFDIRSIRINGFVLLFLSIITLSHSTMQEYAKNFNNNPLIGLWDIYKDYIGNPLPSYMLGGGFVGGAFYMVLSYLLGEVFTLILLIIFLILALIFLTGNSIFTFKGYVINLYKKLTKTKRGVLEYLENIQTPKKEKKGRIGINMLNDIKISMNFTIQKKITNDLLPILKNVLEKENITAFYLESFTGFTASRYIYKANEANVDEIRKALISLNYNPIIYYNSNLIIELSNKFRELLTLKKILLKGQIPLGLEVNDEIMEYDFSDNILISGSYDSGIRTFIKGFLTTLFIRKIPFNFVIIDTKEEFYELKGHSNLEYPYASKKENIEKTWDYLTLEIEKRMELLNYKNLNNIEEYNLKEEPLNRIIVIINGYEILKRDNPNIDQLLMYLSNTGIRCGINILLTNRIGKVLGGIIKSSYKIKMVFKTNTIDHSLDLLDNSNALYLEKRGDFIYKKENIIKRGQTGYLSNEDYKKIIY